MRVRVFSLPFEVSKASTSSAQAIALPEKFEGGP